MCGIYGFVGNAQSGLDKKRFERAIRALIRLSEPRGREATGLAVLTNDKISVYKQPTTPSTMLKSKGFARFLDGCAPSASSHHLPLPAAVIGHARLVTNGSQAIQENNQPIGVHHIIGVHNGIVTNDQDLAGRYPGVRKSSWVESESDSEVLFGLINHHYERDPDLGSALSRAYGEIAGSASVALFCDDLPVLALATNTGSLYYFYDSALGMFAFGSERYIVERFLQQGVLCESQGPAGVRHLKPSTCAIVSLDDVEPQVFCLKAAADRSTAQNVRKNVLYRILDESVPKTSLRRCAQCVLPESYPFISFDDSGVCNYCRKYNKQQYLGREALEVVLEKYRSKSGEPDCIMGFSGGRDSCYGLHVLVKEFRMHPIAYTYDWAMVTDLARRNQAKVAGKLGVEHLIRAADIHTKRRYIRKNIYAWLKKPELGMVPLFMAGDKWFYYYGRQLRKETGIDLTVFAAGQQLEQMEFKVGFCGIDQDLTNNTKLYHFEWMNKMRLAMWYTWQYITNPGYINESLWDSAFAFYSSFINKDDYLYMFYYIPWDEDLIEGTLRDEYGWEMDERYGKNQWRMDDGHTAFIDYIYHTVAGFSEFDNFRSNQIREGMITREEALKLIEEDNRPRLRMLQDFGQLIGFNLEEVLLKINAIPKLY